MADSHRVVSAEGAGFVGGGWHDELVHLPPSSSTLIGRAPDLRELDALYAQVVAGEPRAVVIAGEAGIGKSRLLAEFIERSADSARVLRGQCVDLGDVAPPYAPITAVLRELVAQVGTDRVLEAAGPGWDTIGVLLPELGDHAAGRASENRLHESVALLLEHFAHERPVVLVIEDLHWADDATLTVLRFLLRAVASGPIMIVLTYRSDDVHRGHPLRVFLTEVERGRRAKRLELRRLTRAQVRKQAQSILGRTPDFDLVESVFERSEGVPFFVEELVGCEDSVLPETLRDVLLARYERLDDATQYFLRVVSAGGQRVEHALVEEVFDRDADQLDAAARAAVVANVLVVDDSAYTFRHALVREAVHGDLLPGERTRFHARYAEALAGREKPGDITEIAYHWHAASNHAKAFPAKIAAMRSASQAYAYATAAQMGESALEIWDAIDDAEAVAGMPRSRLMGKVAAYLHTAGEPERALATITLAISIGDVQGPDLARHLMLKAQCLHNIAKLGAIPLLKEALELVPPGADELLRATILYRLAARYMIEGAQPERGGHGHPGARDCTADRRPRGRLGGLQHPRRRPRAWRRRRGRCRRPRASQGARPGQLGRVAAVLGQLLRHAQPVGALRGVGGGRRRRTRPIARAGCRAQLGRHPRVQHDRPVVRAGRVGTREPPARPGDRVVAATDVPGLSAARQGLVHALAR